MTQRTEWVSRWSSIAESRFSEHSIRQQVADGWWVVQRCNEPDDWTGFYSFEVVCLANRQLYVGGDIQHVVFGYGPPGAVDRVAWVASAHLDYAAEKAAIGGSADLVDWDDAVMREEMGDWVAAAAGNTHEYQQRARLLEHLRGCQTHEEYLRVLGNEAATLGDSTPWSAGRVPSTRLFYALAAVRRLHALLTEKEVQHGSHG
jgi:hypothetical protein